MRAGAGNLSSPQSVREADLAQVVQEFFDQVGELGVATDKKAAHSREIRPELKQLRQSLGSSAEGPGLVVEL